MNLEFVILSILVLNLDIRNSKPHLRQAENRKPGLKISNGGKEIEYKKIGGGLMEFLKSKDGVYGIEYRGIGKGCVGIAITLN